MLRGEVAKGGKGRHLGAFGERSGADVIVRRRSEGPEVLHEVTTLHDFL